MTQKSFCETIPLRDLLNDDCEMEQQSRIEKHLESCESCQSRLSELAADKQLWTQAACHLSTIDAIQLPARLTSHLNASSSMFVPELDQDAPLPDGPLATDSDWKRILDPPSHPETLGRIDNFEIESKIGQGGMGIVLKGYDRELNRAVAIKVLAPHLASNGTARKRFAREAQAAAAVMHPNVVPIYMVSKSTTRPYIVMQLVSGHSLESLVHEQGPLSTKDVVRVSLQVAAGLAAAHKIGLIHRDVKPGNVLVEREVTRVMITDFGLARAVDDAGMTQTGWLAGTPHYMSPEQSKGDDLDPRTDLFSLGSMVYFLATGREPFRGDKPYAVIQKIINQRQTDPMDINGDIPWMLADIIEKLLEKDPKQRFQTADELVLVLEQYLAHLQQPTHAKPPRKILTVRRKQKRAWIGSGVLSAIVFSIAAYFMLPGLGLLNNMSDSGEGSTPVGLAEHSTADAIPSDHSQPEAPPVAAPLGFSLDDGEFSQQLNSLAKELDRFDQSLRLTVPLDSTPRGWNEPPRPEIPPFQSVEMMLDSLSSRMATDDVARDLEKLKRREEKESPDESDSPHLPIPSSQPPTSTKEKSDEK